MPHPQYDRPPPRRVRRQPYGPAEHTAAAEPGAYRVMTPEVVRREAVQPPPSFGAAATRTEPRRAPTAGGHGGGALDRLGGWMRKLMYASADTHALLELATIIQRPVTTGRRIAVVAERAGARASTLTAVLALIYAHYRRDRVLAVDEGQGLLERRLGDGDQPAAPWPEREDPCPGVRRVGANLWVPAGTADGLERHFGVTVIDADPGTPAHVTVIARGRGTVVLPDGERFRVGYDRHLSASERIKPGLLGEETLLDVARIAASALEAARGAAQGAVR